MRLPLSFGHQQSKGEAPMNDQDLKNKYQPVADFMSRNGFQIQHFHVENGRAVVTASAPTEYLKNRAWDEIKKVDPSFANLHTTSPLDREPCISSNPETTYRISAKPFTERQTSTARSLKQTTFRIRTKFKSASNLRFLRRKKRIRLSGRCTE